MSGLSISLGDILPEKCLSCSAGYLCIKSTKTIVVKFFIMYRICEINVIFVSSNSESQEGNKFKCEILSQFNSYIVSYQLPVTSILAPPPFYSSWGDFLSSTRSLASTAVLQRSNYHCERFPKLTFRALAFHHSE